MLASAMRFTFGLLTFVAVAVASPTFQLVKRASASDVATIGYATLNGGTSGGSGSTTIRVSTLADLKTAVAGDDKKIIIISGTITGNEVVNIGSNKTILGASGAALSGVGIRILDVSNIIVRNLKISNVLAEAGDAIGIQQASQIWIDHVDLSSDRDHDRDYYDGLLDITHGSFGITVSWSKLHDHWKASLVGHSDSNGLEDVNLRVTYAYNWWSNMNSRTPSFRFGQGHILANYFENNNDGVNVRDGAQLLVEYNVWTGTTKPIYSTDGGCVTARGNDFGGASNTAPSCIPPVTPPYLSVSIPVANVKSMVTASAGATLSF